MKTTARRSNRSLANSDNSKKDNAALLAKIAEILNTTSKIAPISVEESISNALAVEKAAQEKAPKADRLYELAIIGSDFRKNRLYATPTSEIAAQYMTESKALCADTLAEITAPIANDVRRIAANAEKNGGDTLKDDLIRLCDSWKIPSQAMRVIMQLCAPVVACCNAESDDIARRCYGMARANSLMGSACNMLMYSKATVKAGALPFKRVAHNLTALGLAFDACDNVGQCDFCVENKAFNEVVTLCDYWLYKCEPLAEKAAPQAAPQVTRQRRNAATPQAATPQDNAAILEKGMELLGMK